MLKNSKLLKGITLVFALVLLIGCGVVLDNVADASSKTVILYVGDTGDNTSGLDEATALHTLNAAIGKANEMKLPTGSQLKIIVVDRLTITTQAVDSTIALDAAGKRLPITITSLEATSEDDFSDLYLAYLHSSASSSSRYAVFYNDITFENVGITVKVHQDRVGNIETNLRYMQKNLHFIGYETTFDNCVIKPERTGDDVDTVVCYADYSTNNATISYDKVVNIKNGDYTTSAWFLHNYRVPFINLTVNLENASFGSLHVCPMTSTATTPDLRKFTVNVGAGTTVTNLYLTRQGHIGIPDGITINYYEGCYVNQVAGTSASNGANSALDTNITHNIYGGTINTFFGTGRGLTTGDVTVNMSGGIVGAYYGASADAKGVVKGTITNNISGGTITSRFHGSGHSGSVAEKVVNHISGGSFPTTAMGAGRDVKVNSVENYVTGGIFAGAFYGGGEDTTIGTIVNYVSNVELAAEFYGGSKTGTLTSVVNNLENVRVIKEYYGANGSTGTVGDITNNISGDHYNGGRYYGGSANETVTVTGTITNNISGGLFNGVASYGGGRKNIINSVVNTITGGTFTGAFYAGVRGEGKTTSVSEIETVVSGGNFQGVLCGGNAENGEVTGSITNSVLGGEIHGNFVGGNYGTDTVKGNISNQISGGTIHGELIAGNRNTGDHEGRIYTTLSGGTIYGNVNGAHGAASTTMKSASLDIEPLVEAQTLTLYGSIPAADKLYTYLHGGDAALLIGSEFFVEATRLSGSDTLTVSQIESWNDDQVYVLLTYSADVSLIHAINGNGNVSGSGVFNGITLKGSGEAGTTSAAPGLTSMVSFELTDTLGVRFWVEKSAIEAYIRENGSWSYSVSLLGNEVASATFTSMDQLPAGDIRTEAESGVEFFTFTAGIGVPASQYDEEMNVVLGGVNSTSFTVYQLLEMGISQYEAAGLDKYAQLLKAVHNYGTQANNAFDGGDLGNTFDVTYTGTYTTTPSFTKDVRGYTFQSISLSLDEKIAMNFYMDAASDVTFTATVEGTNEALDPSKIIVKKIEGVAEYNTVVTLKLDAEEMNNVYVLTAKVGDDVVATCTNSVAFSCALYKQTGIQVEVVDTILAYLEAVKAIEPQA